MHKDLLIAAIETVNAEYSRWPRPPQWAYGSDGDYDTALYLTLESGEFWGKYIITPTETGISIQWEDDDCGHDAKLIPATLDAVLAELRDIQFRDGDCWDDDDFVKVA